MTSSLSVAHAWIASFETLGKSQYSPRRSLRALLQGSHPKNQPVLSRDSRTGTPERAAGRFNAVTSGISPQFVKPTIANALEKI